MTYFTGFSHQKTDEHNSSEITHEKIDQIAKRFIKLQKSIDSESLKLLEVVFQFEQLSIGNSISSMCVENMSFWYSLKPETLQAVDDWLNNHSGGLNETVKETDSGKGGC